VNLLSSTQKKLEIYLCSTVALIHCRRHSRVGTMDPRRVHPSNRSPISAATRDRRSTVGSHLIKQIQVAQRNNREVYSSGMSSLAVGTCSGLTRRISRGCLIDIREVPASNNKMLRVREEGARESVMRAIRYRPTARHRVRTGPEVDHQNDCWERLH
jgi:hypothetical protein